jgi:hypothetical protein
MRFEFNATLEKVTSKPAGKDDNGPKMQIVLETDATQSLCELLMFTELGMTVVLSPDQLSFADMVRDQVKSNVLSAVGGQERMEDVG